MAAEFVKLGYEVRKANNGEYSNNHQFHVFIDNLGDSIELYTRLVKNNISTNFDSPLGGRLFIRVGTQELTRRGFKEPDVRGLAEVVDKALRGDNVADQVANINNSFNNIAYSFDSE